MNDFQIILIIILVIFILFGVAGVWYALKQFWEMMRS